MLIKKVYKKPGWVSIKKAKEDSGLLMGALQALLQIGGTNSKDPDNWQGYGYCRPDKVFMHKKDYEELCATLNDLKK